jgi:hypothetical protein
MQPGGGFTSAWSPIPNSRNGLVTPTNRSHDGQARRGGGPERVVACIHVAADRRKIENFHINAETEIDGEAKSRTRR